MTNRQRIIQLKQVKEEIRKEVDVLDNHIQTLVVQRAELFEKLNGLSEQIHRLYNRGNEMEITDHAFLRYMERVQGFDIEHLKGELRKKLPHAPSNGNIKMDGVIYVIKNNALVTVLPNA